VEHRRNRKARPPLDEEGLERLALFYAGRYATTRAKLRSYLERKLAERGWSGNMAAPVDAIIRKFEELGYVDDKAFAEARAASLGRRGLGERRVAETLRAAGISAEDGADARDLARDRAWDVALRYAERKRIGPFAPEPLGREARQKAFAAMLRAGHRMDITKAILEARPGDVPDVDSLQP